MKHSIEIFPIHYIPEISPGDSLSELISIAITGNGISLKNKDIVIVTQKIVSKVEGQIIHLNSITPSAFAIHIAKTAQKDPRFIEVVLQQSKRIVRMNSTVLITETHHGFICANAGVDASNIMKTNTVSILPSSPNKSADALRKDLKKRWDVELATIISDTWGRPWREGQVNFAIGSSGISPLLDFRGKQDVSGYELHASVIAIADEIASAAELVMGKIDNIPVAILRGFHYDASSQNADSLLRDPLSDMFR